MGFKESHTGRVTIKATVFNIKTKNTLFTMHFVISKR